MSTQTIPPLTIASNLRLGDSVTLGDQPAFINAEPRVDAYGLIALQYRYHGEVVNHIMRVRPIQPFDLYVWPTPWEKN